MPLDPEVLQWLEAAAAAGLPPMNELPVEVARANMLAGSQELEPVGAVHSVTDLSAPARDGYEIPLRHYQGTPEARDLLVYFHGGGWVVGSRDTHDVYCQDIATSANIHVVSVDYRLSPEFRFPVAAEDCFDATCWLASHRADLGIDSGENGGEGGRLIVAGDSAGGNLAAVTCLLRNEAASDISWTIDGQILIYPITDCDFERESYQQHATDRHLTRDLMVWFWDQYLPDVDERTNWMASPIHYPDLTRLPPAFVMTAEYDPLCDEGEEYASKLAEAGVHVTCKRYDGTIHGFVRRTSWNSGAEGLRDLCAAIERFRGGPAHSSSS